MPKLSTVLEREQREKKGQPPPITVEDLKKQTPREHLPDPNKRPERYERELKRRYDLGATKYGYQNLSDLERGWELYNTQSEIASLKAKLAKIEQRRRRRVSGLDATTRGTLLGGFTGATGAAPTQRKRLLGR